MQMIQNQIHIYIYITFITLLLYRHFFFHYACAYRQLSQSTYDSMGSPLFSLRPYTQKRPLRGVSLSLLSVNSRLREREKIVALLV